MVWRWDECEHVILATIMHKDIFDLAFWTKALRMMILAFSSNVFEVKESDGAICFDLWPWPFKVMTFCEISYWATYVINEQNVAKF